ncbi:hypothetical protein NL108_011815 [Boleophthalmus pectinirostris]|uniref:smoothelin-like 1 n=1 Tax=Boleophthalmus pectinirostris TaxID=150288 RepID=UPI00242FD51C|nr:smoothelin-like 1 [Boleophthalmus pectinirostris]KAJ0050055.1 hypothetical protein NL108_011815 [Boleophthalmus pectinirostris]
MEEEIQQPECAAEKTQCDKNNNSQIALKENIPSKTEEETSEDKERESKKDGEREEIREETKCLDEKKHTESHEGDAEQHSQDSTTDNATADNTDCNIRTEEEAKKEKQEESETKEENTSTNNEEKVKEAATNKTEKKKASKGKDTEVKSDVNKKGSTEEMEKPAKRKSGPSAASLAALSRPRPSARSIRASAKKDLIAKFQQGAPETPVQRNFKLQKSATAGATGASIKQKILQWCINKTRKYEGVTIENFSSSWSDGIAFCALIHRYFPEAFDFSSLNPKEREKNFTLAFQTAETLADCCPLLDVSDMLMMGNHPDPMCIFTYVQSLCHSLSKIEKQRKEKAEKEKAEKKEEEGPQEEEEPEDSETTEGPEETPVINESYEESCEKEENVSASEETDTQKMVEGES